MVIYLLAEGHTEEAVAVRIIPFCGHELGTVYGKRGCDYIRKKAAVFCNLATEQTGVLVLTDFRDSGMPCVPDALNDYILLKSPDPPRTFLCRFAVNELESWLLADREGLAKYMNISISKMPLHPENEEFPKATLISLAHKSNRKDIREGIAPPAGHRAAVGPEYLNLIREFILVHWNIENAVLHSQSLERCVRRLREIAVNIHSV